MISEDQVGEAKADADTQELAANDGEVSWMEARLFQPSARRFTIVCASLDGILNLTSAIHPLLRTW